MITNFLMIFVIGIISSEVLGYIWHRWVSHLGILKNVTPYDFLRKRHARHHDIDYNPKITTKLVTDSYISACEFSFNILALLVAGFLIMLVLMEYLSWWTFIAFAAGGISFGLIVISPFHTLYHLTDKALKKMKLFQKKWVWKPFKWLQDYHEAHHYYNCNYSIVLPVDMLFGSYGTLFGSYFSPAKFRKLKSKGELKKENIFPGFNNSISGCKEPLFVD